MQFLSVLSVLSVFSVVSSSAAQQAWVANYNNGPSTTSRAVAIALDPEGNILVAGTSSDAATGYDYVLLKYSAHGVELWKRRFSSSGSTHDEPRGLVVDELGNAFVTGTSETVAYAASGTLLWSRSYPGRAITADRGHVYVTGFSDIAYATVKLDKLTSSNVWMKTYSGLASPTRSQVITLDRDTNVFIAGRFVCYYRSGLRNYGPYTLGYGSSGADLWVASGQQSCADQSVDVKGIATDSYGNVYVSAAAQMFRMFWTSKFSPSGALLWNHTLDSGLIDRGVTGLASPVSNSVYVCGSSWNGSIGQSTLIRLDSVGGTNVWTRGFEGPDWSSAEAVLSDPEGNAYVTGFIYPRDRPYDYLTAKYSPEGNLQWSKRYNGSADANDQAKALAVDAEGNVYVTGYSTTTNGTEITTIKYIQVAPIEKKSNGHVLLQFPGVPGSNYVLQASTNLPNWFTLGSVTAAATGIFTFEDTNAPACPTRFYRLEP